VPKLNHLPTIDTVALPGLTDDDTGFVYVVGNETGEYVKIGWSTQIQRRLATLQSYVPTPLKVYALIPGTRAVEGGLHERFHEHRAMGEWFRLDGLLLDWLKRNRAIGQLDPKTLAGIRQRMAAAAAMRAIE
jgi:T5orf172 domain